MPRCGGFIHNVHIADGFVDDCDELIHECSKREPLTYLTFCKIWKDLNFASIYQHRLSGAEVAELSEEVIHIAKRYMVANTSNFEESVAGLFLVYALLNLQPFAGFAALRLVPEDVAAITRIELVARRERRYDVLYILGTVLVAGPSQYHAAQRERGMESSYKRYLEHYTSIDKVGIRPKGVFYRQNEELDIIRELNALTRQYTKAKAAIIGENGEEDRSLHYMDPNLASELDSSLKKIINGLIEDDSDDDDDIEPEEPKERFGSVQAIKAKAMKATVNSIRHLTGLDERKNEGESPKKKSDIKTKAGKVKSGSPNKPMAAGSPKKRKASKKQKPKTKRAKRAKSSSDTSDSDADCITEITVSDSDDDMNERQDVANASQDPDTSDQTLDQLEKAINIQIESLPVFVRTEDENRYIEIEVIDHLKPDQRAQEEDIIQKLANLSDVSVQRVPQSTSLSVVGTENMTNKSKTSKDETVFKKPNEVVATKKRDQKKPILKSKFKRMGILSMANFKDSSKS